MKFKGFAEFGLLLASFSYALEKMVDEGQLNLSLNPSDSLPAKKEETFDDVIAEFEKLTKETKNISSFTEPIVAKEASLEINDELIDTAVSVEPDEQKEDEEDLAVVNELRKRILDAFKEKETEVEEAFDVAAEAAVEEIEEEPEEETEEIEEELVFDRFDVTRTEEQVERIKAELMNNFNEYIDDIKKVYGSNSRISNAVDSMAEHASIIRDIKKLYPNLEEAFINEYYRLKDAINSENIEEKKSIILHRLSFAEKEDLLAYADHMMGEGMVVNVDENKLIADVIRPIVTKNGKVMAEIFKVANTAAAYRGFYVGYLVK